MTRARFVLAWALALLPGSALAQGAPDTRPTVAIRPPDLSVSATVAPAPKPKPKPPAPARSLQITNASGAVVASLAVSADGATAKTEAPLATDGSVTLRLPVFRSCNATITVLFEGSEEAETYQQDLCKVRTVKIRE